MLHFVYFYVLWLTIQFAFRTPGYVAEAGVAGAVHNYLLAFIDPFGTLWFIYLLPVFFLVTRLTRKVPPALMLLIGAALEIAPIETHWTLIDEFAARFVYFYAGYLFGGLDPRARPTEGRARHVAAGARDAAGMGLRSISGSSSTISRTLPFISLALGFAGAAAVIVDLGRCWRNIACSISSAIAGATRSSSISASSCRWR